MRTEIGVGGVEEEEDYVLQRKVPVVLLPRRSVS